MPGTIPQQAGCAELLSCAVLELWRCCARLYPGPIITPQYGMQDTVLPIVQLCGAVLRKWPGAGPAAAGGTRRRGSATRAVTGIQLDSRALLRDAANEAVCLADKLAFCLFDEVRRHYRHSVCSSRNSNLVSALDKPAFGSLCLFIAVRVDQAALRAGCGELGQQDQLSSPEKLVSARRTEVSAC
jgi:hypothetical protein